MPTYHVKINHQLTIKEIVLWSLILVVLWFVLDVLFLSRADFFVLAAVVTIGILEVIGNNYTYVSEIIISPIYIEIVYCNQNRIIDIVKIKRTDIQSFEVFANVEERFGKVIQMKGNVVIKTNDGEEINFSMFTNYMDLKLSKMFDSTIQPLVNIAKMQNKFKFKNFSHNIIGSKYANLTMEHYIEHGKRSFLKELEITFNSSPEDAIRVSVFVIVMAFLIILAIGFSLFIFIPRFIH